VLYLPTETGIFLSLDRGKSWKRFTANFPTVRVDEITLHTRDNAMLVATHGRGIWILDHLEPIQEYTQATTGAADAHLFSMGPALQWRQWDDRNDEFWGHQFWVGENPSTQAVIQMYFKKAQTDVRLKITDAAGKTVRDLAVPANRSTTGIQSVCWDMRVDPITPAGPGAPDSATAAAANFQRGGGAGAAGAGAAGAAGAAPARGAGGGGGGRGGGNVPQPEAGYQPANPCGGGAGGGGGRGGGGGGAAAGPMVMPGTYNVALVVAGKVVETKPLKIVADPVLQTDATRKRAAELAMDLHETQRRGQQAADALGSVDLQMTDVAAKVKASKAPEATKAQFDAFAKEFDTVKAKFGIGAAPAGGGGGRGGGGGGAPDLTNVLGRVGSLKGDLIGFGDMVSDSQLKTYTELKVALPKAVADANGILVKAMGMSQTLKKYDVTLTVPAPVK
jgi:hypothetical protein